MTVDDLLLAHAAGSLPLPVGLAVATHLALSAESRRRYESLEALGGHFLDTLAPAPLAEDAWDRLLDRLDEDEDVPAGRHVGGHERGAPGLPLPLRDYVPLPLDGLPWRRLGAAATYEIDTGSSEYQTLLIKVRAGRAVPRHTHGGDELTVVLEGAFSDHGGHYRRGDLLVADGTVDHQPLADDDADCLCLAVSQGPLRLTGPLLRLLNPLLNL